MDGMIGALQREIEIKEDFFEEGTGIHTVYFGGGTPSLLNAGQLTALLDKLSDHFLLDEDVEITLEANPDDLTAEKVQELKAGGITRLSIGIQSFRDEQLQRMNRAHSRYEALTSLERVFSAGFDQISVDMIYGLPGLTLGQWQEDLETLLDFPIDHLSCYALTVEPRTALDHFIRKKNWPAPDDEEANRQFLYASRHLEERGFEHYEISNFSKGDRYSKHNTSYWRGLPFVGLGPSAHSYRPFERSWNVANNSRYIKEVLSGGAFTETESLSATDWFNETLMTGLRTRWGVDLAKMEAEFGSAMTDELKRQLESLEPAHFHLDHHLLRLTREGWLWSDRISASLFQ